MLGHELKMTRPTNDTAEGNLQALTNTKTLRSRARQHVEEGAVTTGYAADKEASVAQRNFGNGTCLRFTLQTSLVYGKRDSFRTS